MNGLPAELEERLSRVEGMLTENEGAYLYRLAQANPGTGAIVEIGSYKGKSTVWLAFGSRKVGSDKVYAVDPHKPLPEEGFFEDTEADFLRNIGEAGVEDRVVPMMIPSEEAARAWSGPIKLLWIDGDHRYEQARKDFVLWEPHLIEGGVVAMHDTIRKKGAKRVLWECIFRSNRFERIAIVDNITSARKVTKTTLRGNVVKWSTIACRGLYIGTRKLGIPYAKPVGRWVLRRLTA